jgi:hypothetical protein
MPEYRSRVPSSGALKRGHIPSFCRPLHIDEQLTQPKDIRESPSLHSDLAAARLGLDDPLEERHEFAARVPGDSAAEDLARMRIERRDSRQFLTRLTEI